MWLTYGIDANQQLVSIADVPSGKTHLHCPYCAGQLTAKKGRVKGHHFAHTGETCHAAQRDDDVVALPLYDQFNLYLPGTLLAALHHYWRTYGSTGAAIPIEKDAARLEHLGMLHYNQFRRLAGYEFTKLGKIPVGALSLALFCDIQEPLILAKLDELEQAATDAYTRKLAALPDFLTDLRIYRTQLRRVLSTTLYLVDVQADGERLYKVGVTSRDVAERVAELHQQLRPHFTTVHMTVVGTWPHRGNVELYFKHRYAAQQRRVGSFTEYFVFDDPASMLRDVRRIPSKTLSPIEQQLLDGASAAIEQLISADQQAHARSAAIRVGMQQRAAQGVHVGRPVGGEDPAVFLAKPSSQRVIVALEQGLSVRKAAAAAGVAINTVRKVQAAREQEAAP